MTVRASADGWERFAPFLALPGAAAGDLPANSIESLNYQLRRTITNRGRFSSDIAVVKLRWLTIFSIEDSRPPPAKPGWASPSAGGPAGHITRRVAASW